MGVTNNRFYSGCKTVPESFLPGYFLLAAFIMIFIFNSSVFAVSKPGSEIRRYKGASTEAYDVLLNPYPIPIGKDVGIQVFVPRDPQKVVFVLDKNTKYTLGKDGNYWRGIIRSPANYSEGWNLAFVYIKYNRSDIDRAAAQKLLAFFKKLFARVRLTEYSDHIMFEGKIWIRAYRVPEGQLISVMPKFTPSVEAISTAPIVHAASVETVTSSEAMPLKVTTSFESSPLFTVKPSIEANPTFEAAPLTVPSSVGPLLTPEAAITSEAGSTGEAFCFKIKGTKSINFVSRSIEGSKEGFVPGLTRDEALRINVSGAGKDGTEVEASFISTSTSGTTALTQNDDKISVLVRRASTEVYLGDFIGDFNDTEFARLNKSLSGIKVAGNYDTWGFKALYATPRGDAKYYRAYGNGTQGPYSLGTSPVVVDSDKVYLDGAQQKRGTDYTIDYQAGTITFKNAVVISTSIIEAYYDWSETLYQHSTFGLRYRQTVNDDLKLGFTYINDSDSTFKASEIRDSLSATIEPTSHYVVGIDGSTKLFGNTLINSELAYSNIDLNILEPNKSMEIGKAFKMDTTTAQGPFTLLTNYKRVGAGFSAIGDAAPQQDVDQYGGLFGFRPSNIYYMETTYDYNKYMLLGTQYLTTDKSFKSKFTPEDIPSLNYVYRKMEDSNDPVTGTQIDRLTTQNNAESSYKYAGFLVSTLQGGIEERRNSEPSLEVTTYRTVNFGTATYGLDKISASGNIELKETTMPDKTTPFTKTYSSLVSATPNKDYFGSLSLQIIDDSVQGTTNVTDLNYRASPTNNFSTDGKYTISSVQEDFNGTPEAVSKQTGSFRFDYRPEDLVKLRYYYKPNFTRVESANAFSFSDDVNQAEVNYAPLRELSTGLVYKTEDLMNIDRSDPEFKREANHKNTYDTTLLVNSAPLRFLSLELSYLTSDMFLTEQTTAGATAYDKEVGNTKTYNLSARTSLSEQFSLDSGYSYQNQWQSSASTSEDIDSLTQTVNLKGVWNIDQYWSVFASYSYSESVNRLLTDDDMTYTIAPGLGATYKIGDILRVDAQYTRAQSFAASSAQVDTYSLNTKYDPNQYVHINIRGTREISVDPDYKSTELMGSLEIVL
jgi:hypothetical protein